MTHSTLQKYTQHVTGRKDNNSEHSDTKRKKKKHVQASFSTGNLPKNISPLILWLIERLKGSEMLFLNVTANHTPINTSHNNDTKIHYVGWKNKKKKTFTDLRCATICLHCPESEFRLLTKLLIAWRFTTDLCLVTRRQAVPLLVGLGPQEQSPIQRKPTA